MMRGFGNIIFQIGEKLVLIWLLQITGLSVFARRTSYMHFE